MSLDKIILELKGIKKDIANNNIIEVNNNLDNLIEKLQGELKKSNFVNNPSDKKRLKGIERVLKVNEKLRPHLSCYAPFGDNKVVFTDSYQAYVLNDKFLPFKVAFDKDKDQDFIDNYIKEYQEQVGEKAQVNYTNYPGMNSLFNQSIESVKFNIDIKDFLLAYKTTEKVRKKTIMQFNYDATKVIYINGDYIKNAIDILKLKDKIVLEIESATSPVYIHNEYNEVALILPLKKY